MVKRLDLKLDLANLAEGAKWRDAPSLPEGCAFVKWNEVSESDIAEMMWRSYVGHGDLRFLSERKTLEGCKALVEEALHRPGIVSIAVVKRGREECGVGWAEARRGQAWISEIGVVPEFRDRGIGEALMRRMAADIANKGTKEIHIGVSVDNEAAVRLYTKLGFKTTREWDTDDRGIG